MVSNSIKIKASDYKLRTDLENYVRGKVGLTTSLKPEYVIEGKREDLAKLNLTDRSLFWGINCVITDSPTKIEKNDKPDRGEVKPYNLK